MSQNNITLLLDVLEQKSREQLLTDTAKHNANLEIRRLAQTLSDEFRGMGIGSALLTLQAIGMLMSKSELS